MPTDTESYKPKGDALRLLLDLAKCEDKRNPNRDSQSISSRLELRMDATEGVIKEPEGHGYIDAFESKRRKGKSVWSLTEKGRECAHLVTPQEKARQSYKLESTDLELLRLARESAFRDRSISVNYALNRIQRESNSQIMTRLERLHKMGLFDYDPLAVVGSNTGKYTITKIGQEELAKYENHERLTETTAQACGAKPPPASPPHPSPVPAPAPQPVPQPAPQPTAQPKQAAPAAETESAMGYLESAIKEFEGISSSAATVPGSVSYNRAMGNLTLASAKKLLELERRITGPVPTAPEEPDKKLSRHERAILQAAQRAAVEERYVLEPHILSAYCDIIGKGCAMWTASRAA